MPPSQESSGSFAKVDLLPLLQKLAAEGFTGSVRADREGIIKVLYISEGRLACASSTDPHDRLGPILRKEGMLTAEQLDMAEEKALSGEALGSVLVNLGFIGPRDLMRGARRQVERVVASLLTWRDGEYRARPGALPERAINLKLGLEGVLVGAARCLESREEVVGRLGSLDAILEPTGAPWPEDLPADAREVWELVDGDRDARTVCAESSLDDFEAAKAILGLSMLGLVRTVERPASPVERAMAPPRARAGHPGATPPPRTEAAGAAPPRRAEPFPAAAAATSASSQQPPAQPHREEEAASTLGVARPMDPVADPGDAAPDEETGFGSTAADPDEGTRFGSGAGDADPVEEADDAFPGAAEDAAAAASPEQEDLWDDDSWSPSAEEEEETEEAPRAPVPSGSGGRRTWLLGASLVILAAVSFYLLLSNRTETPTLETTLAEPPLPAAGASASPQATAGDAEVSPDSADPGTASPGGMAGPPAETSAAPATPPPAPVPSGASPAKPGPPAGSASGGSTRPALDSPPASPRLTGGEEPGAGLAAFRKGEYPRAADLWRTELAAAPAGAYTLQLLAACETRTLRRVGDGVGNDPALRIVPATLSGRTCYRVLWGLYPDRDRAEASRGEVPSFFRETPLPVPVARVVR